MKTSQFEAAKVAIKQDKTGYILTLCIHPDEIPDEILRDFVGARYQVVMVRLNSDETPMVREREYGRDPVRASAMLCKDKVFHKFLLETGNTFEESESAATDWLKDTLGITSRSELKDKPSLAKRLFVIEQEFNSWKANVSFPTQSI